jgi:predicted DNA-binding protein
MKFTKPVNIRLENDTHQRLSAYALSQGTNVSGVIRQLIGKVIKPVKKKKAA